VTRKTPPGRLAPAHLAGLAAVVLAAGLAFIDLRLAVVPLGLFLLVCLAAPFLPRWPFFGKTVVRGARDKPWVALTFDDGPDPSTTPVLLDLLARRGLRAAFFVIGGRAAAYPALIRRMLDEGHEVASHSSSHDPFLMLRSSRELGREIDGCNEALAALGIRSLVFRSPVGIVSPRLFPALRERRMTSVGFSRRGRDFGNRRIRGLARRVLRGIRPGDIVLLHDGPIADGSAVELWRRELEAVLDGLAVRLLEIRPLSEVIGRVVMERIPG
jgi:peptidoglycan/xylan/chitin deacetylase (PgdA/CDA1 family)